MKIAIVWDFLIDRGGAEREILTLARALKADVVTTQYIPEKTYAGFSKVKVISHPLKTYPKPLFMQDEASRTFRRINLSEYDIVISIGDWAKHVSLNRTLRGRHIHITIGPPRMFFDLKASVESQLGFFKRSIFKSWSHFASKRDNEAMKRIGNIIVQSAEGKRRIESYYKRKVYPDIFYPPTETKKFRNGKSKGYFLSVQRIMPEKKVDIQIAAFNRIPKERLIIAGSVLESKTNYFRNLKDNAGRNIEFRTNITDKELINLYSHAKCVIQTATREDFGLVPVEAMASGKPCIAVNEGGFKETIDKRTGILIEKPYEENLIKAVKNFDERKFKKTDLIKRSRLFSEEVFIKKVKDMIGSVQQ